MTLPLSATRPSRALRLLAMDCAGDTLALALTQGEAVRATAEEPGGARASERLLPLAMDLLAAQGWTWADLDGIAFGRGPGAFTGLRTACAVAQGLALGLDRRLLPIDSLLIVAEDAAAQAGAALTHCTVAVDARMGELYHARYQRLSQGWLTLREPGLGAPASLPQAPGDAWAGNGLALLPEAPPVTSWPQQQDRAGALGRLAVAAAQAEAWVDAADALPVYVRDKVALTTAERETIAS
ncbi:MAG: tRNA (adenosine(37)-N6)-threonylcarbamoyltransferase complex dimerization subunit type 1 TsaB [Inhella sp.]